MSIRSKHKLVRSHSTKLGRRGRAYGRGVTISRSSQGSHPFKPKERSRHGASRKFGGRSRK